MTTNNTPVAIIISGALIAGALLFSSPGEKFESRPYQLVSTSNGILRMDTRSGEIETCHAVGFPPNAGGGYAWICEAIIGAHALPGDPKP